MDGTSSKTRTEAHNDPIRVLAGPVTRSRMKKFKEELNIMVRRVCEQAETWRPIEGIEDQVQSWKMMIGASSGVLGSFVADHTRREEFCQSVIDQRFL